MGHPIPDSIANKPHLHFGLGFFFTAFLELLSDRDWISGQAVYPMAIRWSTICAYADAHNLTGELRDDLLYFVKKMDNAYVAYMTEKS